MSYIIVRDPITGALSTRLDTKEHTNDSTLPKGKLATKTKPLTTYNHGRIHYRGLFWFRYLCPQADSPIRNALTEHIDLNACVGKLIVCFSTEDYGHLYILFEHYADYFKYSQNFEPRERNFFEIITGHFAQKAHFDIDITREQVMKYLNVPSPGEISAEKFTAITNELRNAVIQSLILEYQEFKIELNLEKDILNYTSHGLDKRSYHIIVNNYCHSDNQQTQLLYKRVRGRLLVSNNPLVKALADCVDAAVYKSSQQFRILGSQKTGSGRPKIFSNPFTYEGKTYTHKLLEVPDSPEHEAYLNLEESLVSNTSGCTMVPSLKTTNTDESTRTNINTNLINPDLTTEMVDQALILANTWGITSNCFKVSGVRGNLVLFKRTRRSYCNICSRHHDAENPYLAIVGRNVYLDCRRCEKRKCIGNLDLPSATDTKMEDLQTDIFSFNTAPTPNTVIVAKAETEPVIPVITQAIKVKLDVQPKLTLKQIRQAGPFVVPPHLSTPEV